MSDLTKHYGIQSKSRWLLLLSRGNAFAALSIMLFLSISIRLPAFWNTTGAPNLEASYHILLTATSLIENPVRDDLLLPLVTLGGNVNKGIPWGATVPTAQGDYIYTSFPPLGFLAPTLFFKTFGLAPSLGALLSFNLFLHALASIGLYILILDLLCLSGTELTQARVGALTGVAIQIFATEALVSFGVVYWSQELFQVLMIGFLLVLVKLLRSDSLSLPSLGALGVVSFLCASTEWTAACVMGGAVVLLLARWRDVKHQWIIGAIVCGSVTALIVFALQLVTAIGAHEALRALASRYHERSTVSGSPKALMLGYVQSYGMLLVLIPVGIAICWGWVRNHWRSNLLPLTILCCSLFAMVENLLLLQHATEFSFDRLKFAVPLAIVAAFSMIRLTARWRLTFLTGLGLALLQNLWSYSSVLSTRSAWADIDRQNQSLVTKLSQEVDLSCAFIATNLPVRGYPVFALHRNIIEGLSWEQFRALPRKDGCAQVYLEGTNVFTDLPHFTRALISDAKGPTRTIAYFDGAQVGPVSWLQVPFVEH